MLYLLYHIMNFVSGILELYFCISVWTRGIKTKFKHSDALLRKKRRLSSGNDKFVVRVTIWAFPVQLNFEEHYRQREANNATSTFMGRYITFQDLPENSNEYPTRLADNGFFNIGDGIVECFSCHCRHNITDNEQSPENFHSQTCKHRIQYGQMLQLHESSNTDICFENVNQHHDDDRTDYAHEENRFLSFQTSPFDNINQNRDFARAGFYYKGSGDILKCYCCGGEVRNWEHWMDPWTEHARWYPRCHFLREQKGEAFIEQFRINVLQQVSIRNTEVAEGYQEHAEQGAAAVPDMSPEMPPNSGRVPIQCIVCRRRNPDILFLPCRHLKCCAECAHDLRRCMVCSRRIVEKIPVYLQ